jgi:hypothetical protein
MQNPFPGMNPYLEVRWLWPSVHLKLISAIQDALVPQVAPAYYFAIEEHVYLIEMDGKALLGRPDVAVIASPFPGGRGQRGGAIAVADAARTVVLPTLIDERREGYLEIRAVGSHEVVTVIEVISPTNKDPGHGRQVYVAKRTQVLHSQTNLVEIDLLRAGEPMAMEPPPESDYRIMVARGWESPRGWECPFELRDPVPVVKVPLREAEPGARLALGELLNEIYDRARYDLRLDYRLPPPEPALSDEESAWVDVLLRTQGLRA